jgi:hypothetical protein
MSSLTPATPSAVTSTPAEPSKPPLAASSAVTSTPGGPSQPLKFDWIIIVAFAAATLVASFFLYRVAAPPIMISIFLSTGIASFVYKFLGGLDAKQVTIGIVTFGGSLGALVGLAWFINGKLEEQLNNRYLADLRSVQQELTQEQHKFRIPTEQMMVGEWRWIYARGGWEGFLKFTMEKGGLHFTGEQFKVVSENDPTKISLYDLSNGTAHLINQSELALECDVYDYQYKRHFHWNSTASFPITPAFRGELRVTDKPELAQYAWGMMIYKWPAPGGSSPVILETPPIH